MKTKARRISTLITLVLLVAVMVFGVVAIPAFAAEETKEQSGFFTKDPKDPSTYAYSIAVVGDTQTLSDSDYDNRNTNGYVKRMDTLYNWISDNIGAKKIGLVLGLGDIVENWENPLDFPTYEGKAEGNQSIWEWENAGRVFNAYLEDANGVKVPYTLVRGNHDSDNAYNTFIASDVMSDYRAQFAGNNAGYYVDSNGKTKYDTSYMKLTIGTTKWLVFTIDWAATERELDWAADLISKNSDYRVILTMHNYLFHDRTVDGKTGSAVTATPNPNWDYSTDMLGNNKTEENPEGPAYNADGIWERLVSRYSNIDLVLSGHQANDAPQRSQLVGANGKTITQILIDPQSMDLPEKNTSGTGMVAMLYFNDDGSLAGTQWDEKTVDLEWYSTIKDKYFKTANQYTLNLDLYDGGVKTENYGTIPAEYADATEYPFVVFGHDTDIDEYFFLGAYTTWSKAYSSLGVIAGGLDKDALGCILLRDDYTFDEAERYDLHNRTLKAVTLDLGGKTITTTENNTELFASIVATNREFVLNVKNGTLENGSQWRAFVATGCDAGGDGSKFTYNFSNVTFKFAEVSATQKLVAETYKVNKGALTNTQYLNFDSCTFDLTNKPNKTVTLFSMCEDNSGVNTTQNAHINITNSSVVGDVTNVIAVKKNTTDSFKAEIGGDAQFVGEYGFVSSNVMSNASTNPFVFFNGDAANGYIYYSAGKLSSLRKKTTSASTETTIDDYANYVGKTACLIAENYTMATAINPLYIDGEFVIDLCGNTLSRNGAYLFDTISHQATVGENTTKVTIKNGFMNSIDKWFMAFNNNTLTTAHKFFELTFDKVTFKYNSTSARADGAFINAWAGNDDADNYGLNTSIQFNDCIYDFTNAPKNAVMFYFKGSDAVCESDVIATFNGGEIITSNANAGWRLFTTDLSEKKNAKDGNDTANEIHFNNGKDGTPLKIKVSNTDSANQPYAAHYYEATDADYCFKKAADGSYHLNKAYFDLLNSSLVLSGKYAAWNDVFAAAMKLSNSTILLLDNAEIVSEQGTVGTNQNTVTVDLNGKTLYKAGDKYIVSTYYSNTAASNTKITFKNGELNKTAGKYGFFCLNYTSEAKKNTVVANIDFQFDNVTFTHTYSGSGVNEFIFSLFENGYSTEAKGTKTNAVFNNCIFNYRGEIFKLNYLKDSEGANKSVFNIVINGGKLVPMAGAETRATLFSKDSKDTVTFAKTEGGEYTRIIVPATAAAPTYEFNGLKFAKESENGTTTTYILVPTASIGLDFTPKASVTLDSTLIFNIYLPTHAGLGAVTLDGETVALGEAKNGYYVISTPLTASESAEELKLTVELTVDSTALKGSFTFSTVKYAEKLLATAGISTAEQTLAKDMLAYINSAYVYFNGESVAKIDTILNGYTSKAVETTDAKQNVPGLSGATFTLEAKPTVQFFFAEDFKYADFTFKVGNRTLTGEDVEEQNDEYVKFALFAYEMTETFSYTVNAQSGEYNLIAYYAYASGTGENDYKGEKKAELTDLAAKFYNYCLSAKAYRASVIGK